MIPVWSLLLALAVGPFAACAVSHLVTQTPRTPVEQLLLAQSIERSLSSASIPLRQGETVALETFGLTGDKDFAQAIVSGWLGRQGLQLNPETATYRVRLILHALGTEKHDSTFGIPPIQSVLIPIALPELNFYKVTRQRGYARVQLDVMEKSSGRLLTSTPVYEGDVYYNQYTILLWFSFDSTDLIPPPS